MNARVFFAGFGETGFHLERLLEIDIQDAGDELGEFFYFAVCDVESAAYVFDGGARTERVEGDDLRDLFTTVLSG